MMAYDQVLWVKVFFMTELMSFDSNISGVLSVVYLHYIINCWSL